MEVNELRFGNWVDSQGLQLQVGMLNEDIARTLDPIRLTEEWLVKFGFNEKYGSCYNRWNIGMFCLMDSEDNEGKLKGEFYYGHLHIVRYVHQLQNLYFALIGEELKQKTPD